jgi:hypothetical protein
MAASASFYPLYGQRGNEPALPKSDSNAKVILEVVNNYFTMGKIIPSLYLRLFSDGAAECHAEKFSGQEDSVKNQYLPAKEFSEIRAVLNQPGLRDVRGRYERSRMVIDSWNEWELRASDSQLAQDVTISFGSATQLRSYPKALAALGCQIIKIRAELCGDNTDYYRPACVNPFQTK